jgi:hypothetical protein
MFLLSKMQFKLGTVVWTCSPSYLEDRGRRVICTQESKVSLGSIMKTHLKKLKIPVRSTS